MQEIPCEHRFMLNWQRETVKIKYFDYVHDGILCQNVHITVRRRRLAVK